MDKTFTPLNELYNLFRIFSPKCHRFRDTDSLVTPSVKNLALPLGSATACNIMCRVIYAPFLRPWVCGPARVREQGAIEWRNLKQNYFLQFTGPTELSYPVFTRTGIFNEPCLEFILLGKQYNCEVALQKVPVICTCTSLTVTITAHDLTDYGTASLVLRRRRSAM